VEKKLTTDHDYDYADYMITMITMIRTTDYDYDYADGAAVCGDEG
jgi:hypothetical protein